MKKLVLIMLAILYGFFIHSQEIATGTVFSDTNKNGKKDKKEKEIANVAVSNGVDIVLTNDKGIYKLPVGNDNIIFVIKPNGYDLPLNKDNTPNFYYIHKPNGSPKYLKFKGSEPTGILPKSIDFALIPSSKETKNFQVILFGDPQPNNDQELEYFNKSIVAEVKNNKTASFGISLGDIVEDDLKLLPKYKTVMRQIPMPWFNVMGNHDMNYDAKTDKMSDETFEKQFGPANYSFNYGDAHFIVLDDILWPDPRDNKGYWGGLRIDQLHFLQNDLNLISKDNLIIISMHIPLYEGDGSLFRESDRKKLFDILSPFKNILFLTAHTHNQKQFYYGKDEGFMGDNNIHEYNVGTTSGGWYSGKIDDIGVPYGTMSDGTPRGYAFLNISGNKYKAEYKVYNKPKDYQLGIYIPKVISNQGYMTYQIFVNFFMGGQGDIVEYKIDDGKYSSMERKNTYDRNYAKTVMEWDEVETLMKGKRPTSPNISTHIWVTRFPYNLSVGKHTISIKATDRYGKEYLETRTFMVEEPK